MRPGGVLFSGCYVSERAVDVVKDPRIACFCREHTATNQRVLLFVVNGGNHIALLRQERGAEF